LSNLVSSQLAAAFTRGPAWCSTCSTNETGLCKIIQTAADLLAPEPQELAPALASR